MVNLKSQLLRKSKQRRHKRKLRSYLTQLRSSGTSLEDTAAKDGVLTRTRMRKRKKTWIQRIIYGSNLDLTLRSKL
jgi:hypothetical protein